MMYTMLLLATIAGVGVPPENSGGRTVNVDDLMRQALNGNDPLLALHAEYYFDARSMAGKERSDILKHYERWVLRFQDGLARFPENPNADEIKSHLGTLLTALERYEEAITVYELLVREADDRKRPEYLQGIADGYNSMAWRTKDAIVAEKAITAYKKLREALSPETAWSATKHIAIIQGHLLQQHEQSAYSFLQARQQFNEAPESFRRSDPLLNPWLLRSASIQFTLARMPEEAIARFRELESIRQDSVSTSAQDLMELLMAQAQSLAQETMDDQTKDAWMLIPRFAADWWQRHPDDPQALPLAYELCIAFHRLRQWDEAVNWCETTLRRAEAPGADQPDGHYRRSTSAILRSVYVQTRPSNKLEALDVRYPPR